MTRWRRRLVALSVVAVSATSCGAAELWMEAPTKPLRSMSDRPAGSAGRHVLLLGIDGLRRDLFIDELQNGRLPGFAALLGGRPGEELAHAFVHERAIAPFPSVTAAGWSAIVTGRPAAENGVPGNEMLIRPSGRFVAPVPMSVSDNGDLLATYNDQLFRELTQTSTLYDRLHERGLTSWVATNQVHAGADRLLLPGKDDLAEGFAHTLMAHVGTSDDETAYSELDDGTFDTVLAELRDEHASPPNVLMVYASGTDLFAHVAEDGPVEEVQRRYLREQLDGRAGELAETLGSSGDWYVVLVADHGHSEVLDDDAHAIGAQGPDSPPVRTLERAGFLVREPSLGTVSSRANAVLAYQSGAAFIDLADRSRCGEEQCYWGRPPRHREDVLVAADAFVAAGAEGGELEGKIDMVLVREPRPFDEVDAPFVVHLGDGRAQSVPAYLERHPERGSPELAQRLRDLAVGRYGERAGDVILIAHSGGEPDDRYYFSAKKYQSSHGAAHDLDSLVPLVVAHPKRDQTWLREVTMAHVGETAYLHEVAPLVEALAAGRAR